MHPWSTEEKLEDFEKGWSLIQLVIAQVGREKHHTIRCQKIEITSRHLTYHQNSQTFPRRVLPKLLCKTRRGHLSHLSTDHVSSFGE